MEMGRKTGAGSCFWGGKIFMEEIRTQESRRNGGGVAKL